MRENRLSGLGGGRRSNPFSIHINWAISAVLMRLPCLCRGLCRRQSSCHPAMKAATKAEGTRPRFTFSVKRLNVKKGRPLIASGLEGPDLKQSGGGLRSQTFSTLKKTLMHTTTYPRENHSLLGLIGGLREDVRNLFHEEVQLAKTELSEKASHFGRNAVYLAIGEAVGY